MDAMEVRPKEEQATQEEYSAWNEFKKENKAFWMWFNLSVVFFSAGFMAGTGFILTEDQGCVSLDVVLYFIVALHTVNIVIGFINLIGKDDICFSGLICGLALFELGVLIFMQIGYFEAMDKRCYAQEAKAKYYWVACQIIIFYMSFIVVICHFFRKFCQDDEDEDDEFAKNEQANLA